MFRGFYYSNTYYRLKLPTQNLLKKKLNKFKCLNIKFMTRPKLVGKGRQMLHDDQILKAFKMDHIPEAKIWVNAFHFNT